MHITSFPESSENLKITRIVGPGAVARTAIHGDEKPMEEVFGLYNGLINLPDEDISLIVDNVWQKLESDREVPKTVNQYFDNYFGGINSIDIEPLVVDHIEGVDSGKTTTDKAKHASALDVLQALETYGNGGDDDDNDLYVLAQVGVINKRKSIKGVFEDAVLFDVDQAAKHEYRELMSRNMLATNERRGIDAKYAEYMLLVGRKFLTDGLISKEDFAKFLTRSNVIDRGFRSAGYKRGVLTVADYINQRNEIASANDEQQTAAQFSAGERQLISEAITSIEAINFPEVDEAKKRILESNEGPLAIYAGVISGNEQAQRVFISDILDVLAERQDVDMSPEMIRQIAMGVIVSKYFAPAGKFLAEGSVSADAIRNERNEVISRLLDKSLLPNAVQEAIDTQDKAISRTYGITVPKAYVMTDMEDQVFSLLQGDNLQFMVDKIVRRAIGSGGINSIESQKESIVLQVKTISLLLKTLQNKKDELELPDHLSPNKNQLETFKRIDSVLSKIVNEAEEQIQDVGPDQLMSMIDEKVSDIQQEQELIQQNNGNSGSDRGPVAQLQNFSFEDFNKAF